MSSLSIQGEGGVEEVALEAATVVIGRSLESDVRVKDIKASRRHCQISKSADGYTIVDLGSGNGTFVNGVRIKEQKLNPGDHIQVGQTKITFVESPAGRPDPVATPAKAAASPASPEPPVETTEDPATEVVDLLPLKSTETEPAPASVPSPERESRRAPRPGGHAGSGPSHRKTSGKGTGRSAAHPPSGRAPGSESKKKTNPAIIVIIALVVIAGGILVTLAMAGKGKEGGSDVQKKSEQITKKHLEKSPKDYGDAISDWRDWMKGKDAPSKAKAEEEIKGVQAQASKEWTLLSAQAASKPKPEALKFLNDQVGRFVGCECEGEIRKRIVEMEK